MSLALFTLLAFVAIAQAANYSGPLRPQVHFSPPKQFMNDPNGMFYDAKRGIYHYYYQYNPFEPVAGNVHWGHATTPDLYHWTNQPIAIAPDSPDQQIFSGSAVVDSENTSGFFPNQDDGVVAIYTLHAHDTETQHIAYSTDGGYTFTKYAANPVISSHSEDFRDPQVVWHPEIQKWVMTISWAHDRKIGFFTSPNLKDWTPKSNYTHSGLPGVEFECPNLVKFPVDRTVSKETTKDVLFISVNPGAPLGGSGTYYVVGKFNGTHFNSETADEALYNFAKDNYASQWFSGLPANSPPVSIGWANNWDYTNEVPTAREGWRGAQSLPRKHALTKVGGGWVVTQTPFNDLSPVRGERLGDKVLTAGNVSIDFSDVASNAICFDVTINGILSSHQTGEVSFNLTSSASGEYLDGGFVFNTGVFWINRAGTHLFTVKDNPKFISHFNTTTSIEHGRFTFSVVVDRSVFEVFLNEGTQSATMAFYPTSPLDILTVSAAKLANPTTVHVGGWALESSWSSS